ncbi:LOW QUALITY PROTEIN: meteorin-like protein [Hypomesus transpacificus]|uniref:LOW QUALITY PROTEIN: meteorin-like protein n=1 Tax=Hypomesus transpacificus TaxID=137520 RepID=UPI001F07D781|nr:LOW QUALITY PROTEIN: meteorin-like protein [Hypomesus transpacificus]
MVTPILAHLLSFLLFCKIVLCQYSSDQCSWRGSGLTHEGHARDVEQVYLRCSQGSLEWLYPTGAIIVNLRPNTASPAATRLSVCIKPLQESSGTNIYLDRAGKLRLLLHERDQSQGKVHCFSIQEGALFIEAIPHVDISRKITGFQYELVNERPGAEPSSVAAPCQPCSDAEVLLAVCTSDFVARGSIRRVEREDEQSSVTVAISRLYRQKTKVFVSGGARARSWAGRVKMPLQCGVKPGPGDFLLTGTVKFGEAWLGCAPRYKDFLRLYLEAQNQGTNPCHVDTD